MAEVVTLEFCPTEWRYYYDCVRIHSDGENLLVPIHAYPVINDVLFPVRIDFGRCVLNEQYTRTVKLECKVPIQFEYRCVCVWVSRPAAAHPLCAPRRLGFAGQAASRKDCPARGGRAPRLLRPLSPVR